MHCPVLVDTKSTSTREILSQNKNIYGQSDLKSEMISTLHESFCIVLLV